MKLNQYLVAASLLLSSVSVASIDLPHPTLKLSESRSLLPGRYVDFSANLDGYPYHDYVKANLKPTVYFQDSTIRFGIRHLRLENTGSITLITFGLTPTSLIGN